MSVIVYDPARLGALAAQGIADNPLFLFENDAGSFAVPGGTASGGPVENLLTDATSKYCLPIGGVVTFSTSAPITCAAINAHSFTGATVAVQYDAGGGTWTDCGAGSVTCTDNTAVMWRFPPNAATNWRLTISGGPSQPAIANLWAGVEMVMPQRFFRGYAPPIRPNVVETVTNISDGGHYLGSSLKRRGSAPPPAPFDHVPDAFVRGAEFGRFMDHHAGGDPFFFAWRPQTYDDVFFAWRAGDTIQPTNSTPGRRAFQIGMRYHHEP